MGLRNMFLKRRLLHLAAHLYPPEWRASYGDEFAALLDDTHPRWRDVFDVAAGGLAMQLRHSNVTRGAIALGLVGTVVAASIAFSMKDVYRSSALIRVVTDLPREEASEALSSVFREAMIPPALASVADTYGLYPGETDKLQRLAQDIRVTSHWKDPAVDGSDYSIGFDYSEPYLAQRVAEDVTSRILNQVRRDTTPGIRMELLDQAYLPELPFFPARPRIVLFGLGLGAFAGVLAGFVRRRYLRRVSIV